MSILPERTATAAELADHAARIERARAGRQLPRTLHALTMQGARLVPCGHCGTRSGRQCKPGAYHFARFLEAYRRALITRTELSSVIAPLDIIAPAALIRDEVTP